MLSRARAGQTADAEGGADHHQTGAEGTGQRRSTTASLRPERQLLEPWPPRRQNTTTANGRDILTNLLTAIDLLLKNS